MKTDDPTFERLVAAACIAASLLFGAPDSRAAGSEASEAPVETTTAEPDPPGQFDFDLGWNAGPTYHLARRIPEGRQDLPLPTLRKLDLTGRIGGSLFLDGGFRAGNVSDRGFQGEVRRARIGTSGRLDYAVVTEFSVEFGFEGGDFYLNDFYAQWHIGGWIDRLRIGYFDPPMSLEALGSSSARSLMETGSPVAAFAPGQRLGVEVDGWYPDPAVSWGLSVSSVGQSQKFSDASSSALRGVGRVAWRPFGDQEPRVRRLLHLAVSGSYTFSGLGDLRYRARPESFLTPYLVDTGDIEGDAHLLGFEAAWREGPVTVQGEYLRDTVNRDGASHVQLSGAYLQTAYLITGEVRPYDPAIAVFTRIEPTHPFAFSRDALGALEVAARYSWLDLDDKDVTGGVMRSLNLSLIWTLNAWVRVDAGYVVARTRKNPNAGTARIFQSRLELRF